MPDMSLQCGGEKHSARNQSDAQKTPIFPTAPGILKANVPFPITINMFFPQNHSKD